MTRRISLAERVAIVSGAGHGLGRAHAFELAARGAAVVVNDIDEVAADSSVGEILDRGGRAVASYDSVATAEGGHAIVDCAVSTFGSLDILVHNAGAWRNGPILEMTAANIDPVLDVHLRGAFFLVVPAWTIFTGKHYGRILLTSSSAGAFGREAGANYVSAKAALLGLGRALAIEGGPHGILANCLLPMAATSTDRRPLPPGVRERLSAALDVMRDVRQPERVSPLVTVLASEQCPVTGEAFSAGAGRFARVFVGVTEGWAKPGAELPTAEEILDHFDAIEDRESYIVPESVFDEIEAIAATLRSLGVAEQS